jgi:cyclophilin family peptidyl-prolyl cis-trans isomerase
MGNPLPFTALLLGLCLLTSSLLAAQAEDLTPPIVRQAIPDVTVPAGAAPTVIDVRKTFGLQGVTSGSTVRFTTTLGVIDVELFPASTPKTVANFLRYVDRGEASKGGYGDSIIQELIRHSVLAGGSYFVGSSSTELINPLSAIPSEAGIPNATGTIAMALNDGPDSATSGWFFNLADNTKFNHDKDGGPYTVFGRIIENGLETIGAISDRQLYNLSASLGSAFEIVPLLNTYNPQAGATPQDLVYVKTIDRIPMTAAAPGQTALLKLKIVHNTDPALVDATLDGREVTLKYAAKRTGTARVTLQAKDAVGMKVKTSFTVRVQ